MWGVERRPLAIVASLALLGVCHAGIKPTVFISADVYHGGAHNDDVTFKFHLSETPGGTAACTGNPTYTSEVGTMTGDKVLSEDAALIEDYYAGWTILATGGTGAGSPVGPSTISAYNPLTRTITAGEPAASATFGADTTYELTAGTCAAQFTAKGSAGTADKWSNCPEGCRFVGPIASDAVWQSFVSGPIPCTTVSADSSTNAGITTTTLLCPKNTVAAASSVLAAVDAKRQKVTTTAAMTAAAVGQSFEIQDTVVTGTMTAALTLASDASSTLDYYKGWRIEIEFPKASGTITGYSTGKVVTVEWDVPETCDTGFDLSQTRCTPVTTSTATEYVLTADCPLAPKNVPLLVQVKDDGSSPFDYQFEPGSLTSWDPIASSEALDLAKCTVARSVDGLLKARVPAGAFTDAGGNPNVASTACTGLTSDVDTDYNPASGYTAAETAAGVARCNQDEPHMVTSDVTAPTVTVTASDDNWTSLTGSGDQANGDRITFKFVLSEPPIKTTATQGFLLPGGGEADGDLTTGHKCANPVSWGTVRPTGAHGRALQKQNRADSSLLALCISQGTVYYLRCNAIPEGGVTTTAASDRTISIAFAINKFYDLAGTANTAFTAITVISDHEAPTIATTANDGAALVNGSFTNADTTFTFTIADPQSAVAVVPTDIAQSQYPYTISAPAAWTTHATGTGVMLSTAINCNGGTFTVAPGTDPKVPTLLCPALASGGATYGLDEIVLSTVDVANRQIKVATAEATIVAATGPGQTLQLIARYQKGTLATAHASDTTALTVTLPANPSAPDSSATSSAADDYYVGWTIETELPTGKGVVVNYHGTNKVATIEWESVVTDVGGTTTYTLTAPCSASPMNTNLVIESVGDDGATANVIYTFRAGYAPTARTTDATGIANTGAAGAVAGGEDAGIHGVDSDANFAIECALMRPANREITVQIPASSFADASGNPNPASDPFLVTMDQVPPTVTVTIYEADGVTEISDGGTTGSRAAIFKLVASEHVLSVDTASGAGLNGLVEGDIVIGSATGEACTNKKFWGWKDTYYVRCDWTNGVTAKVSIAANKAKDLAGNTCATCLAAVSVTFT